MSNIKIAVDVETSGLEPGSRMTELAAIAFDENGIVDQFERLVNPGMPLPADAAEVNGITEEMLVDAPSAGEVLQDFFDWLPSKSLVAHYAQYDTGIISWEAGRFRIDIPEDLTVICTCEIAKALKETKNNKLLTLAEHYNLVKIGDDHRALSDANLCQQYLSLIYKRCAEGESIPYFVLPWADAGHTYLFTDDLPEELSALPLLVQEAAPLTFTYEDAKGAVTERTITPYGWAETKTGLMFHGMCQLRGERRSFRADRVKDVIQREAA